MTERDEELRWLRASIERLQRERDAARTQADQWREVAEERRVVLERLRQHPVVRGLVAARDLMAPILAAITRARRTADAGVSRIRRVAGSLRGLTRQRGVRRRRLALARRAAVVRAGPPEGPLPSVGIVIVTADGGPDLERLLGALDDAGRSLEAMELVVVDNGDGSIAKRLTSWAGPGREVIQLPAPTSFSAANNVGAATLATDVMCFLNDDVMPAVSTWLRELLAPFTDAGVIGAGAQLLYAPQSAWRRRHGDLTVQHLGIRLHWDGDSVPRPFNEGRQQVLEVDAPQDVLAATAACLAVRRAAFDEVGGFDEGYDFGAEDVDLCLRLKGIGRVVVAPRAMLLHHEGATRHAGPRSAREERQRHNWSRFERLHGPALWHLAAEDRFSGAVRWCDRPVRVAITVTRDDPAVSYGDLTTARRLGDGLEALGYAVEYVERYRDAWYDLGPQVDVLLVLLDTFDVRRVERPDLTVVAWIRNWESRWFAHPWRDLFDLVLTSGDVDGVVDVFGGEGIPVRHRPLAAVLPAEPLPEPSRRDGIVAPVNNWGDDRGIPALVAAVPELEVHGAGWDRCPGLEDAWKGVRSTAEMGRLYRRAAVVLDVSAPHTAETSSVNARVFEALANGAVVFSNQPAAGDLFDGDVATFSTPEELRALWEAYLRDPEPQRAAAARASRTVARYHTWDARARQLREDLLELHRRPRVAFLTGAPDTVTGRSWGDTHLAEAFLRALRRRGFDGGVVPMSDWEASATRSADVTVHLKGRGRAPVGPGQVNVLWVISHPEEVADDELDAVDLVLAGSDRLAEHFQARTSTHVEVMHQATDHERFRPSTPSPEWASPVVFVGNSRFARRPLVEAAVDAGLDLVVHGANWDRFIPRHVIGSPWIPNEQVPTVYASAEVVLNDHWESMRRWGLISNRVFDALACGACVLSDDVPELDVLFPGGVVTVHDPAEVGPAARALLADPGRRREVAMRGRDAVLDAHTFDHRAEELDVLLSPLLEAGMVLRNLRTGS